MQFCKSPEINLISHAYYNIHNILAQ